jgi:hypothetical protein
MLVAFSCKCRASCPSCGARRACAAAAHLVDEVLPEVGVRQWVLTTPPEVRHVLAVRPEALTAHARMFVEEIGRWQKEQARALGLAGGETGAVTFVQRFRKHQADCSNVHFRMVEGDHHAARPRSVRAGGPDPPDVRARRAVDRDRGRRAHHPARGLDGSAPARDVPRG